MQSISSSWRHECQGETAGPVAVVGRNPDITAIFSSLAIKERHGQEDAGWIAHNIINSLHGF